MKFCTSLVSLLECNMDGHRQVRHRRSSTNLRADAAMPSSPRRQDTPRPPLTTDERTALFSPTARPTTPSQVMGLPLTRSPTVFRRDSYGESAGSMTPVATRRRASLQFPGSSLYYVFSGPRNMAEQESLFSLGRHELELVALSEALLAAPLHTYPGLAEPAPAYQACRRVSIRVQYPPRRGLI